MQILVVLSIQIFLGPDYILYLLELGRQFYLVIITSPCVANKMGFFFLLLINQKRNMKQKTVTQKLV